MKNCKTTRKKYKTIIMTWKKFSKNVTENPGATKRGMGIDESGYIKI